MQDAGRLKLASPRGGGGHHRSGGVQVELGRQEKKEVKRSSTLLEGSREVRNGGRGHRQVSKTARGTESETEGDLGF